MSEWLDKIHDAQHDLDEVATELSHLACSFADVGNTATAIRLKNYAKRIWEAEKAVGEGTNASIDESLKFAQQGSATILKACLAGAQMERERK